MPKVLYASSQNSDMRYVCPIRVSDPFFLFDSDGKRYAFVDKREFGIFQAMPAGRQEQNIPAVLIDPRVGAKQLALDLFKKYKIEHAEVPSHFPLDIADFLRSQGIELIVKNPFFPERAVKIKDEISKIKDALERTHCAFKCIEEILRESVILKNSIFYKKIPLTSEYLKQEAERVLLENNMLCTQGIIISSGSQAAIPHHEGHGPIKPHTAIICDIFPMHRSTGYYADMTRTYVKGEPTDEMLKIYEAVKKSQEAGIAAVKPGVRCSEIHRICSGLLPELIHGTGHGLGLDIHEPPFVNARSEEILQVGNVITIEPGLYYPDRGSCRLEDVVVVTPDGCRNLTNYPKELVIF